MTSECRPTGRGKGGIVTASLLIFIGPVPPCFAGIRRQTVRLWHLLLREFVSDSGCEEVASKPVLRTGRAETPGLRSAKTREFGDASTISMAGRPKGVVAMTSKEFIDRWNAPALLRRTVAASWTYRIGVADPTSPVGVLDMAFQHCHVSRRVLGRRPPGGRAPRQRRAAKPLTDAEV